ncbi:MAG: Gfo/Idh/MocA family oxidoreductase [Opitutaceae bacterium]
MKNWSRKEFLKTSILGGGAAFIAARGGLLAQGSANGDVRIGIIGFHSQGFGHLENYLPGNKKKLDGAILAAICDVDDNVLAKGREAAKQAGLKSVAEFKDYRKMLESKDVDAVVIATPNHQHSIMAILALQAGKDVYVEKPLSHNIWEGRQAVEAAKKYSGKNIALIGTQNRSSEQIMKANELLRSGKLGKLKYVTATCYKARDSIGLHDGPQPIPAGVDYDLWTGPAPLTPPTRNGSKGPIHYDWHWFWNYGGGDITNQGIHQMDVARWMLGAQGMPKSVMSFGGRFGYRDDAETPNTLVSVLTYEQAPLIFEVRGLGRKKDMRAMDVYRKSSVGVVAQCENGYINVAENGAAVVYDSNGQKVEALEGADNGAHRKNWIKALQSRKVVHGLIEEGHYSTSLCHLANLSYLTGVEKSNSQLAEAVASDLAAKEAYGRTLDHLKANEVDLEATKPIVGALLQVDPKHELVIAREKIVTDAANNHPLRKREGRAPFKVPVMQTGAVAAS